MNYNYEQALIMSLQRQGKAYNLPGYTVAKNVEFISLPPPRVQESFNAIDGRPVITPLNLPPTPMKPFYVSRTLDVDLLLAKEGIDPETISDEDKRILKEHPEKVHLLKIKIKKEEKKNAPKPKVEKKEEKNVPEPKVEKKVPKKEESKVESIVPITPIIDKEEIGYKTPASKHSAVPEFISTIGKGGKEVERSITELIAKPPGQITVLPSKVEATEALFSKHPALRNVKVKTTTSKDLRNGDLVNTAPVSDATLISDLPLPPSLDWSDITPMKPIDLPTMETPNSKFERESTEAFERAANDIKEDNQKRTQIAKSGIQAKQAASKDDFFAQIRAGTKLKKSPKVPFDRSRPVSITPIDELKNKLGSRRTKLVDTSIDDEDDADWIGGRIRRKPWHVNKRRSW
ncbi:hypothetical protein 5 [Drosophila-associated adintovirus 3]|uniref:WH2 domain-containing protein n=1 Tax=Drosophila-associated adintovirus 3 TaxID=2744818 RepID=A0A7D4VHE3_9VIRU|nr:hypothetical protein 5 [Drosophila-associated adintovirus 3]